MLPALDRRLFAFGLATTLVPLAPRPAPARQPDGSFLLDARRTETALVPGAPPAETWSFAPDPVLRVRHGEEVRATLRNGTTRPLSVHWQGLRGPAAADGVGDFSQSAVAPGAEGTIRFTPPDPGLFLIRPLVVAGSSEPAGRGLGGLLVVEERDPPAADADLALLVRDWWLEPGGALRPFGGTAEAASGGRLGNRLSVAGADAPKATTLPGGSRVRLRLANGCNARAMRIRIDGAKVFVIAVDSQPTETFEPLRSTLPFAPGTRYELMLDLPREPGREVAIVALIGNGVPLATLTTTGSAVPDRPDIQAPPLNPRLPPIIRLENAVRRDVAITGGATRADGGTVAYSGDPERIWKINGRPGAAGGAPLLSVRRGQPVVLAVTNTTAFVQPMHLHGHVFRLLHALDDGWEAYWIDTLQIAEGKTVRLAFLADNPGRWLLSSTVLERFDTGLWTWFEVT